MLDFLGDLREGALDGFVSKAALIISSSLSGWRESGFGFGIIQSLFPIPYAAERVVEESRIKVEFLRFNIENSAPVRQLQRLYNISVCYILRQKDWRPIAVFQTSTWATIRI